MKLCKVVYDGQEFWGEKKENMIRLLAAPPYRGIYYAGVSVPFSDCRLLAPCDATKILAIGQNYLAHIKELGHEVPETPVVFVKAQNTVANPGDGLIIPMGCKRFDFEAELAIVIKERAEKIRKEDCARYVLGYTCLNDVTARDFQQVDNQWARCKSFDGAAPIGPWVETKLDVSDIRVMSRLNGETRQDASTSQMMFDVPSILEFITRYITLMPGDGVATGTPAGVGPMGVGDEIEVEVEGIGVLKNYVLG